MTSPASPLVRLNGSERFTVHGSQFTVPSWFGRSVLFILLLPKTPITTAGRKTENRER